jgi:3-hydroxybutyryl-CoA dehydrogenase
MGEAMTSIQYEIRRVGKSRSFAEEHPFVDGASSEAEITVLLGSCPEGMVAGAGIGLSAYRCVAIELGTESLAFHTGGCDVPESSNVVGFSRWRLGRSAPSNLIELVTETGTKAEAASAASSTGWSGRISIWRCGRSMTGWPDPTIWRNV